ncbi:MAG: SCP2 sterol-binding domain-containing protein [Candidatus Thorarchaeota archaeon]|nr:SCP2 sterol-binding domain-containing protein [Candidatus Thorarchaeota archaeon]
MTKEKIKDELRKLKVKFEDPKIKKRFEGYNKAIQFVFPDIDAELFMQIGNGTFDAIGVGIVETELVVTMDSTVFFGIINKTQSPMAAYTSGKLKTKGDVPDLLKLQKLLL